MITLYTYEVNGEIIRTARPIAGLQAIEAAKPAAARVTADNAQRVEVKWPKNSRLSLQGLIQKTFKASLSEISDVFPMFHGTGTFTIKGTDWDVKVDGETVIFIQSY